MAYEGAEVTFDVAGASCTTTIERIEQRVRRNILPHLGAQPLNGVGAETLRNWKKRLADSHAIRAAPARSVRRLPHPAGSMRGRPSVYRPRTSYLGRAHGLRRTVPEKSHGCRRAPA
ncbi:hypothetical protein ACFWNG_12430 [Streptomyces sp. NPDC058391]|uniref:hypothetical protein n=1 Tax=Streptomyces sp. NPDC058391 TaxID=3346476 RepID=UPI00364C37F4